MRLFQEVVVHQQFRRAVKGVWWFPILFWIGACGFQNPGLTEWNYYVGPTPPSAHSEAWKPYRPRTRVPGVKKGNTFWLRTVLPRREFKDPAIYFHDIAEILDARLHGRRLLELGELIPKRGKITYRATGNWPVVRLPAGWAGGELLIRAVEPADQREGILGGVYLGEHRRLQTRFIAGEIDLLILGFLFLLMAIFALAISAIRRDGSTLAFGLFGLFAGMQALAFCEILLFMLPEAIIFSIRGFIIPPLVGSLFFFFDRTLNPGPYKMLRFVWIALFAYGFFLLMTGDTPGFWFSFTAIPLIPLMLFQLWREARRGRREASFMITGIFIFALTALNDALLSVRILPHTAYIMHWGVLSIALTLAITLARRFSANEIRLREYSRELEVLNRAYERFVPAEFLEQLGKENIVSVDLGDQVEKTMTILFSDIRSFTELSEGMSPGDTFAFINEFLERMGPVIRRRGGFIDKYIGDAIMALFPGKPDDALEAAQDMLTELNKLNEKRRREKLPAIDLGIGIHMGRLMLGTIGEAERMEGTVISDSVNLASRLEGLTKTYAPKVIVSEAVYRALENPGKFSLVFLGEATVKGKQEIVRVHGLEAS